MSTFLSINYKFIKRIFFILFSFLVFFPLFVSHTFFVHSATGINETINFQAKIVNTDGTNSTATCGGSCNFRFRIFDQSIGGTELWQETQSGVSLNDGVISIKLGSSNPFGTAIDFNDDSIYLEVTMDANGIAGDGLYFDGYEEIFDNPRLRFTSVAYAMNAKALGGKLASDFVQISPTSDQTTGNITNTIIHINEDGTSSPDLLGFSVGGVSRVTIDNNGASVFSMVNGIDIFSILTGSLKIGNGTPNLSLNGEDLYVEGTFEVDGNVDFGSNIDLNNFEAIKMRIENLSVAPVCDISLKGKLYHNTTDTFSYICDGSIWKQIDSIGGGLATLDVAYTNDTDKIMNVNNLAGLEFINTVTGNITFDLQNTGDFVLQDNDTTFLTISDDGSYNFTLDVTDNPSYTITNLGTGLFVVEDEGSDTTPFVVDASGNVGIGTNAPSTNLHVVGDARITGLASCDIVYSDANGNLNCGTDQGAVFDVFDNTGGQTFTTTAITINLDTTRRSSTNYTLSTNDDVTINSDGTYQVTFSCGIATNTNNTNSITRCWLEEDTGGGFGEIDGTSCFTYSRTSGTAGNASCGRTIVRNLQDTNLLRVRAVRYSGNGTMRTVEDSSSLSIAKIIAPGADVAEIYYTKDTSIEAGEVVSVDSSLYAGVKKSIGEYENNLLGVISTNAGQVIGYEQIDSEGIPVLVALAGRVPVKIDPLSDEIFAGDYITSSNIPGLAKKAIKSGIVIGKALEDWTSSSNIATIQIFVTTAFYDPNDGIVHDSLRPSESPVLNEGDGQYVGGVDIGSQTEFFNNVYAAKYYAKSASIANVNVSENYATSDPEISAGDVVFPVFSNGIEIAKSSQNYEKNVMGVVATTPGVTLSEWEDNEKLRPVALAGRVPVKVTTENGPIYKGDRLVASSIPGFAMSACGPKYCEQGMSIGIALEDFDIGSFGDSDNVVENIELAKEEIQATIEEVSSIVEEVQNINLNNQNEIVTDIVDERITLENISNVVDQLIAPMRMKVGEGRVMMFVNLTYISDFSDSSINEIVSDESVIQDTLDGEALQGDLVGIEWKGVLEVKENMKIENELQVIGKTYFGKDSIGQAIIREGDEEVRVIFSESYAFQPIVVVSPIGFYDRYAVEDVSINGFIIRLESNTDQTIVFNWHAFASEEGLIFNSDGGLGEIKINESPYLLQQIDEDDFIPEEENNVFDVEEHNFEDETIGEEVVDGSSHEIIVSDEQVEDKTEFNDEFEQSKEDLISKEDEIGSENEIQIIDQEAFLDPDVDPILN